MWHLLDGPCCTSALHSFLFAKRGSCYYLLHLFYWCYSHVSSDYSRCLILDFVQDLLVCLGWGMQLKTTFVLAFNKQELELEIHIPARNENDSFIEYRLEVME